MNMGEFFDSLADYSFEDMQRHARMKEDEKAAEETKVVDDGDKKVEEKKVDVDGDGKTDVEVAKVEDSDEDVGPFANLERGSGSRRASSDEDDGNIVDKDADKDERSLLSYFVDDDEKETSAEKNTPEEIAIAQQAEKEAGEPIKKAKKFRMKSNIVSELDDGGDEESYAEWNGEKGYSRPDGFPLLVPADWPNEDEGLTNAILGRGDKRLGDAIAEYYAGQIGKDEDTYANPLTRVRRHKGNIYVDMSGDDPIPFMLTPEDMVEMEKAAKQLRSN